MVGQGRAIAALIVLAGAARAGAEPPRPQAGAAVGIVSFEGSYQGQFETLWLTVDGGARLNRWFALGVRVGYFHGGETNEGALVPSYETTYLPIALTARAASEHAWVELGVGPTLTWIVDGDGDTVSGSNGDVLALSVGVMTSDPTVRFHPELSVSYLAFSPVFDREVWAVSAAAGVHWH